MLRQTSPENVHVVSHFSAISVNMTLVFRAAKDAAPCFETGSLSVSQICHLANRISDCRCGICFRQEDVANCNMSSVLSIAQPPDGS